jgi:hypothetical protein
MDQNFVCLIEFWSNLVFLDPHDGLLKCPIKSGGSKIYGKNNDNNKIALNLF